MNGIPFPHIDPIAFAIGPIQIHWYALAYLIGFLGGWLVASQIVKRWGAASPVKVSVLEDLLPWCILGTILGGRLIYILVYNPTLYWYNPLDIFKLWQGGMSFHGGLVGVILAIYLFAHAKKFPFLAVTDIAAVVTPIGLFFGRIANFVNGELFGRITDMPWGVIFPQGGPLPRHPSQLYEALLEGLVLFIALIILARRKDAWTSHGLLSGVFLSGYALSRFLIEFAREPDVQIGYLAGYFTMGQLLCVPMFLAGLGILAVWKRASKA